MANELQTALAAYTARRSTTQSARDQRQLVDPAWVGDFVAAVDGGVIGTVVDAAVSQLAAAQLDAWVDSTSLSDMPTPTAALCFAEPKPDGDAKRIARLVVVGDPVRHRVGIFQRVTGLDERQAAPRWVALEDLDAPTLWAAINGLLALLTAAL